MVHGKGTTKSTVVSISTSKHIVRTGTPIGLVCKHELNIFTNKLTCINTNTHMHTHIHTHVHAHRGRHTRTHPQMCTGTQLGLVR
jgi:hypothetical protein